MSKVIKAQARLAQIVTSASLAHILAVQTANPDDQWFGAILTNQAGVVHARHMYLGERPGDINAPIKRLDVYFKPVRNTHGSWTTDFVGQTGINVVLFPLKGVNSDYEAELAVAKVLKDRTGN